MAIRNKDFDECCNILDRFKHIVLDHDYFFSTPLHWAAKSNFFEIIPKLIAYGASVNEKNLLGNTPLHLSASQNYFETSIFLLLYLASPFIKNKEGILSSFIGKCFVFAVLMESLISSVYFLL